MKAQITLQMCPLRKRTYIYGIRTEPVTMKNKDYFSWRSLKRNLRIWVSETMYGSLKVLSCAQACWYQVCNGEIQKHTRQSKCHLREQMTSKGIKLRCKEQRDLCSSGCWLKFWMFTSLICQPECSLSCYRQIGCYQSLLLWVFGSNVSTGFPCK